GQRRPGPDHPALVVAGSGQVKLSCFCQLLAIALLATSPARANEPVTLRMASVAPDGAAWAREFKAFAREVAASTQGQVQIKWYLGGIAGDELRQHERV